MTALKIAWGLTGYGPLPFMPVYTSHLRAIAWASRVFTVEVRGAIGGVGATDRMYTHSAENELAWELLQSDCTHLFMTEMDMVLPKHTLVALAELDKPIASGVYFLRHGQGKPCLYKKAVTTSENPFAHSPVHRFPETRPFRVDCPGLGCALIQRQVFEQLEYPWFDLAEKRYGSDMYFYTKVREAGIEAWAHPGVMCDQMDYTVVGYADYVQRLRTDPAFGSTGFIIGDPDAVPAAAR